MIAINNRSLIHRHGLLVLPEGFYWWSLARDFQRYRSQWRVGLDCWGSLKKRKDIGAEETSIKTVLKVSDDQQTGYCQTSLPTRISLTSCPFSYLSLSHQSSDNKQWYGEWFKFLRNWRNEIQRTICQGRHWKPAKQPIGMFQQCYNQQISRFSHKKHQTGCSMYIGSDDFIGSTGWSAFF